ncbi:MAG: hypothetical protein MjAS7_2357 [Metallosphaera javensis (ex Sakai et al. 2022)]|nr:MAG: hypothetical protein MjAS7_2357 [Metallosphaera javensis (ex Sakai et al. 2022)]
MRLVPGSPSIKVLQFTRIVTSQHHQGYPIILPYPVEGPMVLII